VDALVPCVRGLSMKRNVVVCGAVASMLSGMLAIVSMPAAQNRGNGAAAAKAPDTHTTPRLANGHPDFTGFWGGYREGGGGAAGDTGQDNLGKDQLQKEADGSLLFLYLGANGYEGPVPLKENQPPYKPEYMEKVKAIAATKYGGTTPLDPQHDCKPNGLPRAGFGGFVVSSPLAVAVLYEASPGPYWRLIYTDGREHPKDLDTSYFGHSIGRWEGDTLVVDTVALNDETWLGGDTRGADKFTSIHSDKEHVVERWTRTGNTVTVETTVEDPIMFTRPWVLAPHRVSLAPADDYIQPQMCLNNDKPHLIAPSATDQFKCVWCNPESLYGGDSDKLTGGGK